MTLKQNAISNIQYDSNVSGGNASATARGDVNSAISSLEEALSHTKTDSSQRLQLELSLFTLEVGQQDKTKSKQTLQSLIKEFPNNPIVQLIHMS